MLNRTALEKLLMTQPLYQVLAIAASYAETLPVGASDAIVDHNAITARPAALKAA